MPKFRFETTASGQTTAFEEELASADMASPRAIEKARAAMVADGSDTEQSGSVTRVYDEAGYLVATVNFSDVLPIGPDAAQQGIGDPPASGLCPSLPAGRAMLAIKVAGLVLGIVGARGRLRIHQRR